MSGRRVGQSVVAPTSGLLGIISTRSPSSPCQGRKGAGVCRFDGDLVDGVVCGNAAGTHRAELWYPGTFKVGNRPTSGQCLTVGGGVSCAGSFRCCCAVSTAVAASATAAFESSTASNSGIRSASSRSRSNAPTMPTTRWPKPTRHPPSCSPTIARSTDSATSPRRWPRPPNRPTPGRPRPTAPQRTTKVRCAPRSNNWRCSRRPRHKCSPQPTSPTGRRTGNGMTSPHRCRRHPGRG